MPTVLRTPWVPFVVASLCFTVLLGALNGALNLWSLHVLHRGVPVEHHQSHAVAQLFGFMWLLTAGVSFHLAPRLFGAPPAPERLGKQVAVFGIVGVTLVSAGRLGALLPFSALVGLAGGVLLLAGVARWTGFVVRLYRARSVVGDALPAFVVAGAVWWAVSAAALFAWQLGQSVGGPFTRLPLEVVTATALFGGTASWLLGISFRAGACSMRIDRPSASRQRVGFWAWQLVATVAVLQAASPFAGWTQGLSLGIAAGSATLLWVVRPFQRAEPPMMPGAELLVRFAMLAAWSFLGASAGLFLWHGLGVFGVPQAPLLKDAARHAFTLGFAQLAVFGFAGRMLPSFEGVSMPWRWLYDAGVFALVGGAALRVFSVASPWRPAMVASGVSGFLALLGVTMVALVFARTMWLGRENRRGLPERSRSIKLRAVARA
ncbi:MAG: hypothetical protein MUC96_37410 [Myxococcaceae bacterium]|nr:hypothetical protein [Myxococcaceae bacterium]